MTVDIEKLEALAKAATKCSGPMRVETDYNGAHQVVGDGSWKILSAWHTPDGKGMDNAEFYAAANPAAVLELIAELKRAKDESERLDSERADLWRERRDAEGERDTKSAVIAELRAECEELRQELDHSKTNPLYSTRSNSRRYVWLRDNHIGDDPRSINLESGSRPGLNSAIDSAMSKEAAQ